MLCRGTGLFASTSSPFQAETGPGSWDQPCVKQAAPCLAQNGFSGRNPIGKHPDPTSPAKFSPAALLPARSPPHLPSQKDIFSPCESRCVRTHSRVDTTFPNSEAQITLPSAGAGRAGWERASSLLIHPCLQGHALTRTMRLHGGTDTGSSSRLPFPTTSFAF